MKKILILTGALILCTKTGFAITATGNASVIIEQAITATQTQQMNFGIITPLASAGTAILSPAGAVSSGTLSFYGTPAAAEFSITAAPSTTLTITYSNGTVTSGGNNMTIDTFTSTSTPSLNTTDGTGALALLIGGTLHVGANQPSGTYTGTYTVTVSY